MKTKIVFSFTCMLVLCMAVAKNTMAQQPTYVKPANQGLIQMQNGQLGANYSFHVFDTPNKTFGYDILIDQRVIFHQAAFYKSQDDHDVLFTKKEQANIAALLTIEKIKRGMNPELSGAELKKITAH